MASLNYGAMRINKIGKEKIWKIYDGKHWVKWIDGRKTQTEKILRKHFDEILDELMKI